MPLLLRRPGIVLSEPAKNAIKECVTKRISDTRCLGAARQHC
jgi:hypothetical protein